MPLSLGPLDLISIEDDVSVSTGAYIHTTRWSGQSLQVGPIRLESGCKIGMRAAVANSVTVGRGTWITPFTPILADVGPHEMWEGAPARLAGRCTELKRTASACQYTQPIWLLEILNVLMQGFLNFWLSVAPTIAISWVALGFMFPGRAVLHSGYFGVTPPFEIVWRLALYGFVTNWVSIVVTSTLGCLFIRCTAAAPGLYPSHGLRGALLMYRMNRMNVIQRQWTWTIIGQYLRALAGVHFPRVGASECDVMVNLVPELASADSRAFWCNQAFTNMLDYGAEHFKLRRLDLPRNFFSGNNSVAEYGNFPANFLLGVSTPASDIRFRRQMRSRLGEPITVAGNPPVRFASASFEAENETLPGFSLFLTRVVLNDLVQHRHAAHHRRARLHDFVPRPFAIGAQPGRQRAGLLPSHRAHADPVRRRDQGMPRRAPVGSRSLDAVLVLEALRLFLRAGLLLRLVPELSAVLCRDRPRQSRPAPHGMPDRPWNDRDPTAAMFRLERGGVRQ